MEIRQVQPSDQRPLRDFYARLSEDSRRARFLAVSRGIADTTANAFCTLDHVHDQGFVATEAGGVDARIVGHVCLLEIGPTQLELGIAVADDRQGRGIGRQLFEAALHWAAARHFTTISATCLADNSRVLALLSSASLGARVVAVGSGLVDVTIPLQPPLEKSQTSWPEGARRPRAARNQAGVRLPRPVRVWRQPTLTD